MATAPTAIDLSRVPAPAAIAALDYETLLAEGIVRFLAQWNIERAANPLLPVYDVDNLETDPAVILLQAWSYLRLLDRQRVNDAVKAVLAPFAKGTDLDNVVARVNITRAEGENDAALLRRYLLRFDTPAAGSVDGFLFHAFTAWPTMLDAVVIGREVHGRRGDTDIVIIGPAGRLPTTQEITAVRAAVSASHVKPEAVAVTVLPATRVTYQVSLVIDVPRGPDAEAVRLEALARVKAATDSRTLIGAEVPVDLIAGAAYGANIVRVRRLAPAADIAPDPYSIPVCDSIGITVEVI